MEIILPVIFGLESTAKDELLSLGYNKEEIIPENGRIRLSVPPQRLSRDVARCNIRLRTVERVLAVIGSGHATTFDELYDLAYGIDWKTFIPESRAFYVNGYSRKSKLFGIRACQSIIKKAAADKLLENSGTDRLREEKRPGIINIKFSIIKDKVTFMADTSGDGLHKRGYRPLVHGAPLKETLAAGLVMLSARERFSCETFIDPMCGSGTIPIETALIDSCIAPGINRTFAGEKWPYLDKKAFSREREEALDMQKRDSNGEVKIFGFDSNPEYVRLAKENAARANVQGMIHFARGNIEGLDRERIEEITKGSKALIITNPPYGERLTDKRNAEKIYSDMGTLWLENKKIAGNLRLSVIAPCNTFEKQFGNVADKRRKLYNGNIPCNMYHYFKSERKGD